MATGGGNIADTHRRSPPQIKGKVAIYLSLCPGPNLSSSCSTPPLTSNTRKKSRRCTNSRRRSWKWYRNKFRRMVSGSAVAKTNRMLKKRGVEHSDFGVSVRVVVEAPRINTIWCFDQKCPRNYTKSNFHYLQQHHFHYSSSNPTFNPNPNPLCRINCDGQANPADNPPRCKQHHSSPKAEKV